MQRLIGFIGLLVTAFAVQACAVAPQPDPTQPGVAARKHVLQRVSAVIVTDRTNLGSWVKRGFPVSQAPGDADGGSATPIAPDGYFLTADHVLARSEERNIYVIYGGGKSLKPHRARIVWRSEGADLALLHINFKTPLFYQFTPAHQWLPIGTPLMHGGIATGFHSEPGKLGTSLPPSTPLTTTRKFKIDIPLQPGDSGGPVIDAYGRLIGINSAVEFLVPMETAFFVDSEASRPNPATIESLIENDRARNSRTSKRVE